MKKRKLLALLVSASMTLNTLGYSVLADENDEAVNDEVQESTEQTDQIPEETEVAETAEEPEITDESAIPEETEIVEEIPEEIAEAIEAAPFNEEVEVDGMVVSVIADEGVFPAGAYLNVVRVEDAGSEALIEENYDENVNIAHTITFDITIYDSEGNEIEPDTEAGNVYVSFTDSLVADSNLDVDVYHITDEDVVIELDSNVEDELLVAETDGFSYYTLVFSYNSLSYEMDGDTTVPLTTILDAVGLSGTVSSVTSSQTALVTATETNGVWYVTALRTFNNPIELTVNIGSTNYTINISPNNTYSQVEENDYMGYRVAQVTNTDGLTFPGMNIYGFSGSDHSASGRVNTTCYARGYRSVMRVGDETEVYFENFAYGKPYYSDGVESYITAEIQDQAVYLTYHITNNNTTDSQVRIASYGDCNIGSDDHAVMTRNGNGLSMVSANEADNGARFFLLPGYEPFDTLWVGCTAGGGVTESYMRLHVFDNSIASNDGTRDSALAWSWNINVPAGTTVTRVAILAITPDVATKTVTLNLNDGSGSTESVITIGDMGLILPVNTTEVDGYVFSGWSTEPDNVAEYADGATVPIEVITENFQLYGVWTPEGAQISDSQRPTAVDAVFDPNGVALANEPQDSLDGYTVMYRLDENDAWSSTVPEADHVGDYTVYYMFDGDPDIPGGSFTSHVTVATPAAGQIPTANGGAYESGGRPLVIGPDSSNIPAGYHIEYRTSDSESWGTSIPKGGVGTYSVQYRYVDDQGHVDIVGDPIEVTVTPATGTLNENSYPTAVNNAAYTGGAVALANAPDQDNVPTGYTVKYSLSENGPWSETVPTGDHAGDYTVYYMYDGVDSNYTDITDSAFHFTTTIAAAAPSAGQIPTANGGAYVAGGRPLVIAPADSAIPAGYHLEYSTNGTNWSTEIPKGGVGTYNVQYRYVDAAGNADIVGTDFIEVVVTAATGTLNENSYPTAVNNAAYTGGAVDLANAPDQANVPTGYTVKYSLSENGPWSETVPTGDHAGNYTVYYMFDGVDSNYTDITDSAFHFTTTIAAAAPSAGQIPTANGGAFVAGGRPLVIAPADSAIPVGYHLEYSTNGTNWSTEIPKGGVGTHNVQYRYVDAAGNADIVCTDPIEVVVTAATGTLNENSYPTAVTNAAYTGGAVDLANAPDQANVPTGYTVKYSLSENGPWSETVPTGDHAGSYTVYYMFDGVNNNYTDITDSSFHFTSTIAAAAPSDSQKPTANDGAYVEGGRPLVIAPADSAIPSGYHLEYSTDGTSWDTEIPTGGVGTYNVQYRYVDATGHEDYVGGTIPVAVTVAAAPDLSTLTDDQKPRAAENLFYTTNPHDLIVPPDPSDMPTGYDEIWYSTDGGATWSKDIPTGTDRGTYNVTYKYTDSQGNHAVLMGDTIPVTIYAAEAPDASTLRDDQKPTAVTGLVYDGQFHELVTGPSSYPDNYEEIWYSTDGGTNWFSTIPSEEAAGEYSVMFKYVDSQNAYADLIGGSVTATIRRGEAPDATSLTDNQIPAAVDGLTYTGSAQALVTAPSSLPSGYEQVWYSTDNGATWSQNIPTGIDAGNYNVSVKYVDTDHNLEDLTGVTVPVTIAPAEAPSADSLADANRPSAVDGLAYTGSAQALVNAPSALPSGYEQVWYSTDGGNTWSQSIPTGTDAGDYNVSVKYVDTDNNYADLIGVTVPVTIAPAAAPAASSLTASQKPTAVSGLTYTGEAQALVTAPSSLPSGYEQVWYSTDGGNTWSQTIPTGTDAGNYNVSVKYVDTDGNYADLTGVTVPVTIASAASAELTADQIPTAASGLTYTGSAQALVTAPSSLPDGYEQVWYSLDGGNTWSQTIPTGIDAGTYTVSVRYVDADGILPDIYGPDITVSIAAATTTAVIAGESSTVTVGQPLTRPADPSRYGYDFTGWYVDEACTIPYDFSTPVGVLGVSLYPGWTPVAYTLVSGAGSSFNAASTPNLVFRAVRNNNEPSTFSHFTGIKVDGNVVAAENYTAVSGSVIVTLNADYLKTLSAGEHTLEILFNDGPSVTTTFTIAASVASTGETPYSVYTIIGALLIATAAAFVFKAGSREA